MALEAPPAAGDPGRVWRMHDGAARVAISLNSWRRGLAMAEIGLFEAMYSARALRRFKPDPVPEEVLAKILDAAIRAPSAGNAQNWAFVVVRDPEQRRRLGADLRKAADIVGAIYAARARPPHMSEEQYRRLMSSGSYLWSSRRSADVASSLPQARGFATRRRAAACRAGTARGRARVRDKARRR